MLKCLNSAMIISLMREAGAQLVYIDTDNSYFQYGRTYRAIEGKALERLDCRVYIYIHAPTDVQVLFYSYYIGEPHMESRNFKTLQAALKWSEREVK